MNKGDVTFFAIFKNGGIIEDSNFEQIRNYSNIQCIVRQLCEEVNGNNTPHYEYSVLSKAGNIDVWHIGDCSILKFYNYERKDQWFLSSLYGHFVIKFQDKTGNIYSEKIESGITNAVINNENVFRKIFELFMEINKYKDYEDYKKYKQLYDENKFLKEENERLKHNIIDLSNNES